MFDEKCDYLFTDETGTKVIEIKKFKSGSEAGEHRDELSEKLGKYVISWCHMGMRNPKILKAKKKK